MKKPMILFVLLLITVPAAVAEPVGFGACGGILLPVAQEDQESGFGFGLKVRANLPGPLVLEPNLNFGGFGDAEIVGVGKRDGASLTHYGIDVTCGGQMAVTGFKPYAFLGGAVYNTSRDGDETTNKMGWSFGGGVAAGITPKLDIDLRGRFNIASAEGSASRKSFALTVGVNVYPGKL